MVVDMLEMESFLPGDALWVRLANQSRVNRDERSTLAWRCLITGYRVVQLLISIASAAGVGVVSCCSCFQGAAWVETSIALFLGNGLGKGQ